MNIQKLRKYMQIILVAGDLVIIPVVYFMSFYLRSKSAFFLFHERMPIERILWITHYLWLLLIIHIIFSYFHGLYDRIINYSNNEIISRSFQAVSIEMLTLVAVYFFRQDLQYPRSVFMLLWFFILIFSVLWRIFWLKLYQGKMPQRNLLIVGADSSTAGLLKEIDRLPAYRINIVGILTQNEQLEDQTQFMGYPILGSRESLLKVVQQYNIDEVVISSERSWQDSLIDQISKIDQISARICIIPTSYEILISKINHIRLYDIPLIELIKHPQAFPGKRIYDFVGALSLFIITLPVFFLTIAAIKTTSGSPVFFKQLRIGRNRKAFSMFKFRTLIQNAENETGPILTDELDNRITKIGRFLRKYRIDELPQLINIIAGEMSFVGPRPERPYFVKNYIDSISGYGERFKASPGITGLAQVNGGYATTPENKLKYDLTYIYNQSFWLDLRIMFETIKVILAGQVNP